MNHMMYNPLLISAALNHAARHHGRTEIVTQSIEGGIHRYTYSECEARTRRLAVALKKADVLSEEPIGTIAWNTYRHVEIYFATSGIGAVCHTINPRLHIDQITYIINHAKNRIVFFDLTFLPLVEQLAEKCTSVEQWILMTNKGSMPKNPKLSLVCYEDMLSTPADDFSWPELDENSPSGLCYTSGSTGNPKGVMYTHRSTMLHCYAAALPDALNCSAQEVIMPVVPMFHVNAWGLPYIAAMVGAKLVLPGYRYDSESIYALLEEEAVSFAAGVPTVWLDMVRYIEEKGLRFTSLRRIVIGGATTPRMLRDKLRNAGVDAFPAWGMTETSPVGTCGKLLLAHERLTQEEKDLLLDRQGRALFGIDIKIVNHEGQEQPWDGNSCGELMVRGHWVVSQYYGHSNTALVDGWFPTGDVATIDKDGFLLITDRLKDVIKSGGEWISSIEIENLAIAHPEISIAACVPISHEKWGERPVLFAVRKSSSSISRDEVLNFLSKHLAKWSVPDDVIFLDELPINATGKVQKLQLRELLRRVPA